ncbi:hypothetical protein [Cellulomonas taurus]|uniref:hypothetical protein n=1 Tax=Cellulomonas taurus TaxID=2729175 RepID=UPI00145E515B|nr:hypothetical protein [Cellulomonas taurus]
MTTLHASISLKPPNHDATGHDPHTRELTESGDTYEEAMAAVRVQCLTATTSTGCAARLDPLSLLVIEGVGAVLSGQPAALAGITSRGDRVKGSVIAQRLARVEQHVTELRIVMVCVTVIAGVAQVVARAYPGSEKDPSPWPTIALWTALLLVAGTAVESIWGLARIKTRRRREKKELELHKTLVSVLVEVAKLTKVDVDVAGANVWSIYTPRGGEAPCLFREAHERLSSHPQMSDRAWTKGKGLIGRCWEKGEARFQDWGELQRKHENKSEMNEAAWRQVPDRDRWGFERDEYLDLIRKYQQIIAVPITDSQGKMIGCLSVDIPADRPAPDSRCLDSREVRLVLATAAEGLRSLIPSSTV